MLGIFLENGCLDVYEQDIETSWVAARFAEGIRDAYTTDITIPKTANNIQLLNASGLLDNPNQLYGSRLMPAALSVSGEPLEIYIQVVEVGEDEITICCFERTEIESNLNKKFRELVTDDYASTIYDWNDESQTRFPTVYARYNYGTWYAPALAQIHGSQPVQTIMQKIQQQLNITLPVADFDSERIISTRKKVCPWCHTQMWEGNANWETMTMEFRGGQHITNDLGWNDGEANQADIKFNRDCSVYFKLWFSWIIDGSGLRDIPVYIKKNGVIMNTFILDLPSYDNNSQISKVKYFTTAVNIQAGDVITIEPSGRYRMQRCSVTVEANITNYYVSDDDYNTDLHYIGRKARIPLYVQGTDGIATEFASFDGDVHRWRINHGNTVIIGEIILPYKSLSYFGLWANMPDVTVADFLFSYAFSKGKKLDFVSGQLRMIPANETIDVGMEGNIDSIRFDSDKFGRTNYIKYAGDEKGDRVSVIDNIWLENEHTIFSSVLAKTYSFPYGNGGQLLRIFQYYPVINDDGDVEDNYTEIDGVVMGVGDWVAGEYIIRPITNYSTMDFETITSITEVDFTTFDARVRNKDFVYYQGRKYMVIDGNINNNTGESRLTMLLIPTT